MPQTALPMNPGKLLKMGSGPMELSRLVVAALGPWGGSFFSDALAESTWFISYMPVVCGPEDLRAQGVI